jgi:hypothetical protein
MWWMRGTKPFASVTSVYPGRSQAKLICRQMIVIQTFCHMQNVFFDDPFVSQMLDQINKVLGIWLIMIRCPARCKCDRIPQPIVRW